MKLTPRLKAVAELVPKGTRVADIGSDHAYVPVHLVRSGRAISVIASDVHHGPVENAQKVVEKFGLDKVIEVRHGSGFETYKTGEIDVAILAGMGGYLIRDLIIEGMPLVKTLKLLVLQPMVAMRELRAWLLEQGFEFVEERVAVEGKKYYEIFSVHYSGKPQMATQKVIEIGQAMIRSEDAVSMKYLAHKINKLENLLLATENAKDPDLNARLDFQERLKLLKEVMACLSIQKN